MKQIICTVDVVLLTLKDDGLYVALLKRENEPYQHALALPGGYIHPQEDNNAREAALRVLRDKTGIHMPYLEQLATFTGLARDPRGWSISVAFYALVPFSLIAEQPGVKWVAVAPTLELPFDHKTIIDTACARLRQKSQYSSLPCHLAGEVFTLPQLQRVYEALLGEEINKVSFRRKMTEMDILEPIEGEMVAGGAHRPAQAYRLKAQYRDHLQLLQRGFYVNQE